MEGMDKKFSLICIEAPSIELLDIRKFFKNTFDYVIERKIYSANISVYNEIRKIYKSFSTNPLYEKIKIPITLSCDSVVSLSTITSLCERFVKHDNKKSDMHIVYLDRSPDLSTGEIKNHNDLVKSIVSSSLGIASETATQHPVNIAMENIHYLGINEDILDNEINDRLNNFGLENFSIQIMRKKNIKKIVDSIVENIEDNPAHIVIDLCCMNKRIAPSVFRQNNPDNGDGFSLDEIEIIIDSLKRLTNICGIDIVGYNFGTKKEVDKNKSILTQDNILTCHVIETILSRFIEIKRKSVNIVNESTKFIIWREINEPDPIGWNILRGISAEQTQIFIEMINEGVSIIDIPNDSNDPDEPKERAFVAVTTMEEQNNRSYYFSDNFRDHCLFPDEKTIMLLELMNFS
jgi:arginase family enzyme